MSGKLRSTRPVVDCPVGRIKGNICQILNVRIEQFLGIRYAKAPIGELRFAHPEPYGHVKEVNATRYGASCLQPQVFSVSEDAAPIPQSEDCLFLNVFRKRHTKKGDNKAVMVIIHGGGFSVGGSSDLSFNGGPLAGLGDVVTVSMNYRLGILGFADMLTLAPGNLGLFDQRLALEWVQQNIRDFGGNPERVTLIGVSAGSMSVCAHIMSPLNRKGELFHAVIMDAGVLTHEMIEHSETSFSRVKLVARKLGCSVETDGRDLLQFLRQAKAEDLVRESFDREAHSPMLTFVPTGDDIFISKDAGKRIRQQAENFIKVRSIIGVAKDEGTLFANYYFDGRPFPQLNTEADFLNWCSKLARAYHYPMDLDCDVELRRKVVEAYHLKHPSPFQAVAAFLGDGLFKCPTNAFVQSYSRFNKELYVYHFERVLKGTYFELDSKVLGAYHFSPFLHFTGAVLDRTASVHTEDQKMFLEFIGMISNFAKVDEAPAFRNIRWPNYAKGEGVMVLNDEPSIRDTLPSLHNGKHIFSFYEDEQWLTD